VTGDNGNGILRDFVVMVESADGTLRTIKPEAFRLMAGCSTAMLLSTCVERYNAKMAREGIGAQAHLVPRRRA
jgi:hypothetical protein